MKGKILLTALLFWCAATFNVFAQDNSYVGMDACKDCHEKQYSNFKNNSKKARSFVSIKKMEKKLTSEEYRECFECHTTGYGKAGGFVSEEKTPDLMNAGCEVCHGPGALHVESEDPEDIISDVRLETCDSCHSKDRIEAFDFKPLLFGGAH